MFFGHCHSDGRHPRIFDADHAQDTRTSMDHPGGRGGVQQGSEGEPWAAGQKRVVGKEEQFNMFSPFLAKFAKFRRSKVPVELGVLQGVRQECYETGQISSRGIDGW